MRESAGLALMQKNATPLSHRLKLPEMKMVSEVLNGKILNRPFQCLYLNYFRILNLEILIYPETNENRMHPFYPTKMKEMLE